MNTWGNVNNSIRHFRKSLAYFREANIHNKEAKNKTAAFKVTVSHE